MKTASSGPLFNDEEMTMAFDSQLWCNIVDVLELKLRELAFAKLQLSAVEEDLFKKKKQRYDLSFDQLQYLNQVKCHAKLHGKKLGLKRAFEANLPDGLEVAPQRLGSAINQEWKTFHLLIRGSLENDSVLVDKFIDFYHVLGAKGMKDSSADCLILETDPNRYFLDTKRHDSWHRLRKDHL